MERIQQDYPILTVREATHYLRVSEMTILRLVNQGFIPGTKIGRQWRFPREAILNLVKQPQTLGQVNHEARNPIY